MPQRNLGHSVDAVIALRHVCAELAHEVEDRRRDRASLAQSATVLHDLAAMVKRRLRQVLDTSGGVRDRDLRRAVLAYERGATALQWFEEHRYCALTFELRRALCAAQQGTAAALDALHEWEQAHQKSRAPVRALRRARV